GIDSAILVYSLNNGPLVTRRMPNVGGINFRDSIFTVDGDSVRYYIEAVDNSPRRFRKKLPDTTAFIRSRHQDLPWWNGLQPFSNVTCSWALFITLAPSISLFV
ncbi:MAG: hypothetical protein ACKO7X_11495, partial [Bacteroidota bacterium]